MVAHRRKEEAEAFKLATQQALICAPASPTKSSPQCVTSLDSDENSVHGDCSLLRLSPEVRGRIYYYALGNDFYASLDPISSRYPNAVKTRSRTPALMRVCSQTRAEAGAIWYSETIYIYRFDTVLYRWLQLIGPSNQKLVRTVRRDTVLLSKRWAEAYIAFTHSRLEDQRLLLADDAIEVAFWEPSTTVPAKPEVEQSAPNAALVAAANAALEHVIDDDNAEIDDMLLDDDGFAEGAFEFDPDLDLGNFAENFLDNLQSDDMTATTGIDVGDFSSNIESKSSATSVVASVRSVKDDNGDEKKKAKKPARSAAGSVIDSTESAKDIEKREKSEEKKKAEKKKVSPSSLAESVMSTKSAKGDKTAAKKSVKPKKKKEPEPGKTWTFVRTETVRV